MYEDAHETIAHVYIINIFFLILKYKLNFMQV